MSDLFKPQRVAELGEPIWGKPSCCVVIWDGKRGGVSWPCGEGINRQITDLGTSSVDELFDVYPPLGISIWEGHMAGGKVRHTMDGTDYEDVYLVGGFRAPKDIEIGAALSGQSPWNPDDWYEPEAKPPTMEETAMLAARQANAALALVDDQARLAREVHKPDRRQETQRVHDRVERKLVETDQPCAKCGLYRWGQNICRCW